MLKSNTIRFSTDTFGDELNFVDETPTTFTITWKNHNGKVLATKTVEAGVVPTYSGETPTKAGNTTNTYTFSGWSPTPITATADAVYIAQFTATLKHYTVTFKNYDGTILATKTVEAGVVPTYSGETPTKAGNTTNTYTFSGWSPTPITATADAVYIAQFTATLKHYTVTFKNYDGTTLATKTVSAGSMSDYVLTRPTRAEDENYTYTFKEWSPTPVPAFADATYTAVFSQVEKEHPPTTFTITWKNHDGTVLTTSTVEAGSVPTYSGTTPTKEENATNTYTFSGWSPTPVAATADAVYIAQFTATLKECTLTWKNDDGTTLKTDTVRAGSEAVYSGTTPTKSEDNYNTYIFKEWSPTPAQIFADMTYTATYTSIVKQYTITWKNDDGTVLLTKTVNAGALVPTYTWATPTKAEDDNYTYTFFGWGSVSDTTNPITEDVEFIASYTSTKKPPPEPAPAFLKQALLISKTPLDCTEKTTISNFLIEGEAPTGTKRRLIFKIDDALYKFNSSGKLIAYTGKGEFADVIKNGSSAGWLNTLSNITEFVGKKIYPIIALQAPYDAEDFPTIKVSLVTSTSTSQLTNTQTSPVYEIADEAQTISEITDKTTITGQATCTITVRLRNNSNNTGTDDTDKWSAYMTLAQAAGKQADAVQFKIKSVVTTTDGTDSVEVKSIAVSHSAGEAIVSGSTARLFSTVQNYELDLQTCYVVVRHAPLVDAVIEAYVNFMELPKHRDLITIGTATGSRQELTLGLDGNGDKNIVATSIRLYADEVPLYNFDFSTEISTVILSANKGAVITASYDYDYGTEEWIEMNARVPQPYNDNDGTYASRFFLNLSHANTVGKKISNVMIRLRRLSGTATENLGVATGKKQLFTLKHKAKPSTIAFTNTADFSYDEESGILALVAARGTALNVAYNWQGENITVRSFAAGWIPTAGYDYQEGDYEYTIEGGGSSDYVLPTMAPNVKGGAKNGTGLVMAEDTVNVDLTTAVETPYFDEEPRIFVGEGVYNYDRHAFTEWYVGLAGNGVTLEGAPEPAFHLIDGVYYSVYGTQGAGESGEWIIPIRGKENVSVRGSGYSRVPDGQDGTVDIPYPERDLVEHEDFIITNRSSIDARTFFNVDPDAYYALDNYPDLQVLLFNNPSNATLTNVTIWADGHDAGQETKVANIIIGDNLILTGGTLNAKPMNTKDRKLLDYLHEQFDSQIPT